MPTAVYNRNSDDEIVSSFSYTYRGDGNIATETDHNNVTTVYTYDLLGRLVSEVGGCSRYYSYDVSGNRTQAIVDTSTTISYTYDSDGRLVSEISNNGSSLLTTSYVYDSNGSLISENDGDVTNYAYDVWGNMISAGSASYAYNAQGLRISKTVSGVTDNFVLVGGDVWADSESTYLRGLELISSSDYFYLYNIRGDVIQLLDYDGEVVKTYDYDAYGNELSRDLADENPFRYCGEYYDTETGLIYLRARYYDPTIGRFTSVDPAKHGTNWYVYCGNNPVIYIDRNGKVAETVFDVISVISSIAEVCINPTDLWAWAGLVGDVIDLAIPLAGGIGEAIKGFKAVAGTVKKVTDTLGSVGKLLIKSSDKFDEVYAALKHLKGSDLLDAIGDGKIVASYKNLKKLTGGKNLGAEVHHLIEKRFAKALGIDNADDILSIVITDKAKHQEITSAFRSLIKYDTANSLGTSLATPQEIWKSIVEVYRKYGMDEYLDALKEHILTYAENAGKITDWMGV